MKSWKTALSLGLGLAVLDGILVAILFGVADVQGESPNAFGILLAFLIALAGTVLMQVGIIAWGVELGTRRLSPIVPTSTANLSSASQSSATPAATLATAAPNWTAAATKCAECGKRVRQGSLTEHMTEAHPAVAGPGCSGSTR